MHVFPGVAYPLGATFDGSGVNFALFSEVAEQVELCLFDPDGDETRVRLPEVDAFVWHGYFPDISPGQLYGYRVYGAWDPIDGHLSNPNKLLLDPYAKAIEADIDWDESLFGYRFAYPDDRNDLDSAAHMPKSVVINPFFDWQNDRPPRTPYNQTVIYEAHVKGLTYQHPDIPVEIRGTYAAIAHPVMIDHFWRLGVTAVQLMPVHQFIHEHHLVERGLTNYWGYSTIGYFAPHSHYSSRYENGRQVLEFKAMVRELHRHGIEVILDVVYSHSGEGNHLGPTLCFRGIDNSAYYQIREDDPRYYMDYTGAGNSLRLNHPQVRRLIMDSLRYWVLDMHVDGFRFDLAAALAREADDVYQLSTFFDVVQQDPVISRVKLVAEPWDVSGGGHQVPVFPSLWASPNRRFRDVIRDFWRGVPVSLRDFAYQITGSSDSYESSGRRPVESINFVTTHDGLTLHDLVSYNEKHNEANGEGNRDGESHNRSWNCGAEGETDDLDIVALREKQKRNFIATLLLSQGVPMLLYGDEIGRTQRGNNNGYCQDNETSWVNWKGKRDSWVTLDFTQAVVRLRRDHPLFRHRRFFQGRPVRRTDELHDIAWFSPSGEEMSGHDWDTTSTKSLAVFLNGEGMTDVDARGQRVVDDSFLLLFNPCHLDVPFVLPSLEYGHRWEHVLDTAVPFAEEAGFWKAGAQVTVEAYSLQVLRRII